MRFTEESEEKLADSSEFSVCNASTLASADLHTRYELMGAWTSLLLSFFTLHTSIMVRPSNVKLRFPWFSLSPKLLPKCHFCYRMFKTATKVPFQLQKGSKLLPKG